MRVSFLVWVVVAAGLPACGSCGQETKPEPEHQAEPVDSTSLPPLRGPWPGDGGAERPLLRLRGPRLLRLDGGARLAPAGSAGELPHPADPPAPTPQ